MGLNGSKGLELTHELGLDDDGLFVEWESWSISKKVKAATIESLEKFRVEKAKSKPAAARPSAGKVLKKETSAFEQSSSIARPKVEYGSMDVDEETSSQSRNPKKRDRTSDLEVAKTNSRFSERTARATVAKSFSGFEAPQFTGKSQQGVAVDLHPRFKQFEQAYRWNYNTDNEIHDELESRVSRISSVLVERDGITPPVDNPSKQTTYTAVGMIGTPKDEGVIDQREIYLHQLGKPAERLDVLGLPPTTALFRGQVVAVTGVNPQDRRFIAQSIHTNASLDARMFTEDEVHLRSREFHMMVAAGPYTTGEDMSYEPLNELLRQVKVREPSVLVLCGPFVDVNHPSIVDGSLERSFDEIYEIVMNKIGDYVAGLKRQPKVVVIPSLNDATHPSIVPQIPLKPVGSAASFHYMPNPCVIRVNSFHFAFAPADALLHLETNCLTHIDIKTEEGRSQAPNRQAVLTGLATHMLNQQSLYPLYPPHPSVPIDMNRASGSIALPDKPDAMIFTSALEPFIATVGSVLALNAGTIVHNTRPGYYAEIKVAPSDPSMAVSLIQRAHVEVVKI